MGSAILLRSHFEGNGLRLLARQTKDASQARRLLALASIYDGGSCADAARLGSVTVQILRDWVVRFNARGPDGLVNGKVPGKAAALVMPWCDTHAMNQHLIEISRNVADDAHAILIMDQAGWHMSNALGVPENISVVPLPPKSPELNPVENIWQFMRDNWLSNRVFKSYDDIVEHCCHAWKKLQDRPWKIITIGRPQWAHRF